MHKKNGFTLIELIIVIIILGVLAVTAAPKFINLSSDAKAASMNAIGGALNSAKDMVYSAALITGMQNVTGVSLSDKVRGVPIAFGYPKATSGAIKASTTIDLHRDGKSGDFDFKSNPSDNPPNIVIFPNGMKESDSCTVTYNAATVSAIASVVVNTSGC